MTPKSNLSLGLILTASAGFVDVIAFLQLGGFFASFVSGNTTQLGAALAGHPNLLGEVLIALPLALIALFFIGGVIGTLVVRRNGKRGSLAVMGTVALTLVLVSVLRLKGALIVQPVLLLAAAMGAQNAAVQPIGAARLGVTYVTGTLFNAAADFAGAIRGEVPKWRWLQHGAVWFSMMAGAVFGGFGHSLFGLYALLIPAAAIFGVMIAFKRM